MKLLLTFFLFLSVANAQNLTPEQGQVTVKDGIKFEHAPSHFMTKMRLRIQNRLTVETKEASKTDLEKIEFLTRRLRLRFDGHAFDPRFLYRVQLAFTRDDQDWDNSVTPNILRDAVAGFQWHPKHTIWFGNTKLPGNRQRVNSSGNLQFVDRSLVNATFNVDRDQGVFHVSQFGDERPLWLKVAVSNGEGRNQKNPNSSLATTARLEWLPLGSFKDDGDYSEADLSREETPKVSFGIATNKNQYTNRSGGQIGKAFPSDQFRSIETHFVDFLLKYQGWSFATEAAKRNAGSPIVNSSTRVTTGEGINFQGGYVFESNWEPTLRYTQINAGKEVEAVVDDQKQYAVGLSKYFQKHTVKIQSDLSYTELTKPTTYASNWALRLQAQIGF